MPGKEHEFDKTTWDEGLAFCNVCRAGEGELLKWCPGFRLTPEAKEACYQGNVVDLDFYRASRNYREKKSARKR